MMKMNVAYLLINTASNNPDRIAIISEKKRISYEIFNQRVNQLSQAMRRYGCNKGDRVAEEVVQIHSGYGYMGEYDVERFYRDAKIIEIYEGTKEIEKIIISRTLLGK